MRPAISARSEQPQSLPVKSNPEPQQLSGCLLKSAFDCRYTPFVEADDILRVDFDIHAVRSDGLYLVEVFSLDRRRVEWRGCRLFAVTPTGLQMDVSGAGKWVPADLGRWGMDIAGKVLDVYRSVGLLAIGGDHARRAEATHD